MWNNHLVIKRDLNSSLNALMHNIIPQISKKVNPLSLYPILSRYKKQSFSQDSTCNNTYHKRHVCIQYAFTDVNFTLPSSRKFNMFMDTKNISYPSMTSPSLE